MTGNDSNFIGVVAGQVGVDEDKYVGDHTRQR